MAKAKSSKKISKSSKKASTVTAATTTTPTETATDGGIKKKKHLGKKQKAITFVSMIQKIITDLKGQGSLRDKVLGAFGVSRQSIIILNDLMINCIKELAIESGKIATLRKAQTIQSDMVITACQQLFPGLAPSMEERADGILEKLEKEKLATATPKSKKKSSTNQ